MSDATAFIGTDMIGPAVQFRRGSYSERIPFDLLDCRIRFYRDLCGPSSPSAAFYRPSLEALEAVKRDLEARDE